MADNKRNVRIDRIIILILMFILFVILILLGISIFTNKSPKDDVVIKPENNNQITEVKTVDSVKITLDDYDVYVDDTDKMGFDFIIAKMTFTADVPVSFDLGNLQTSEKIYLNDVSKYISKLEESNYKVSRLNYVNSVSSDQNSVSCMIFIPFSTNAYSLNVYNALDSSKIEFYLDHNIKYITSLRFNTEQEIDVDDTRIKVSKSYISTMMLHNGEEYNAEAYDIYTFEINVEEIQGDVMITDAMFANKKTQSPISCLSKDFESVKINNALGKKLVLGSNGALFFEMPGHDETPEYDGDLIIYFSNSSQPVKISTTLE